MTTHELLERVEVTKLCSADEMDVLGLQDYRVIL